MKKLSFALLTGLSILAISAFTFCSTADAKTPQTAETAKAPVREKAPAKKTSSEQPKAEKSNVSEEIVSIEPASKVEDGLTWYLDLNAAHAASEKEDKPILGFFTGSDWCGWCIKLHNNVFKKEEFKTWAKDNVILMEIDFPRRTPQAEELKDQNRNLQRLFQVSGYPTVWYFSGENNKETGKLNLSLMGKTGYPRSQPGKEAATFIAASENIINPPVKPEAK